MIDLRQPSRSEAPHLQIELKRLGYEGRFQELRTLQQKAHRRSPISNEARSAVLSLSKMMLERHGYQVITASGPKEALHLFEVWPQIEVDLLMVDLVMPDMNGVELAQRVRALRPELPVLYFSAYSNQEALRPVLFRTVPYIAKPFNSTQLTMCIRSILDAPQPDTPKAA